MALSVVQSAKYTGTAAQTNMTFTLGTTPVVGNNLYMICLYWTGDNPFLVPTGWTLANKYEQTTTGIAIIRRTVQSGDGTSWNLTVMSSSDQNSGLMYEITGDTTTGLQFTSNQGTGTSITGSSITPASLGMLAFSFVMSMSTAGSDTTVTPTGYTKDQAALSSFQPGWGFHKTALTANTTTALTPAVTGLPSGTNAMTQMLIPSLARNLYWVGGTGNWSDTTHWSATTGGTGGNSVPTSIDTVHVDSSSGTGTITIDQAANTGNFAFSSAMNLTNTSFAVTSLGSYTHIGAGTLTLGSATWTSQQFTLGNFDGTSTPTVSAGTSTVVIKPFPNTSAASTSATVQLNNSSLYNLTLDLTNTTYGVNITQNATITVSLHDFTIIGSTLTFADTPRDKIQINSGATITISGNMSITPATNGDNVKLWATSTTNVTFSKASGTVALSNVDLKSLTATGGATFTATNSVDNGNNVGWSFLTTGVTNTGAFFAMF